MIEKTWGPVRDLQNLQTEFKEMKVFAFDTETPNYKPRLLSISDGEEALVFDINKENVLHVLIEYFRKIPCKEIVLFAHNLFFDMTVLLNQCMEMFLYPEMEFKFGDCDITFFNDHPYFGEIKYKDGKTLHLRDTYAFFGRWPLGKLAAALEIPNTKMEIDKEEYMSNKISYEFKEYAKEDARIACLIGQKIMDLHAMEDIRLCISGPQFAMSVFRKKFIPWKTHLNTPREMIRAWELSYHGGKNGCYREAPQEFKDTYLYDFNSAYPFAMTKIPNFLNCKFDKKRLTDRDHGILLIDFRSKCRFNSTFTHDFKPVVNGHDIWITSYELRSMEDHGCFDTLRIKDTLRVVPQNDDYNPLAEYAEFYYKMKAKTEKTSLMYQYYKIIMLNSLYGKFIERRKHVDKTYTIRGPNYNPALASLITGHCRGRMHELEHSSDAIHSATDSVFTQRKLHGLSKVLGGISCEGYGNLKLLRTKLYMFYNGDGSLIKAAMHGFHGNLKQLEHMWKWYECNYEYQKFPRPAEMLIHKNLNLKLWGPMTFKASLNIDWSLLQNLQKSKRRKK